MGNRTLPILMIIAGGILVYCAVKNKSPRDVISEAIGTNNGGRGTPTKPKNTGDTISTIPTGGLGVYK